MGVGNFSQAFIGKLFKHACFGHNFAKEFCPRKKCAGVCVVVVGGGGGGGAQSFGYKILFKLICYIITVVYRK